MNVSVNSRFLTQRVTGVQRYAREITSRLPGLSGVDSVIALSPRPPIDDFALTPLVRGHFSGHVWEQVELPSLIPRNSDVLWSPCNVGPVTASSHVVTIHDLFSISRPEWVSRAFRAWYGVLLPILSRRAARIITVSDWSKTEIVKVLRVPEHRVHVIPEGVDSRFSPPSPTALEAARSRLRLPDQYILTLGSLEPRKNLERVVRGWAGSRAARDLPLLIGGGLGSKRVFGDFQTDALLDDPRVRHLGYVSDEDLPAVIGGATLLVYAALEEGFGLPPIEALACGTEVVTSNTSAMAEYCSSYCQLVDPLSVANISEGIDSALSAMPNQEARYLRAGEVRRRFDWTTAAQLTVDVFREL